MRDRLRSRDNQEFTAAYWELYLHELFIRLGYEVTCEPILPSGRKIDFLVSRGGLSLYVEATIARSSAAERAADARRNRLYEELERVSPDNFMLGIEIEEAGPGDMPGVALLRIRLEQWLASLDPDTVVGDYEVSGELPELPWESAGWTLRFEAYPVKPERRGDAVVRPLGVFMDETGGAIDDETPLRRALNRKTPRRYGDLDHAYIIAVNEYSFEVADHGWHRKNVLFGREAVLFGDGLPPRSIRQTDGFWRGPGRLPRNRRVAAVLLCAHLYPWELGKADLEWWDNPFAAQSVPEDLVPPVARRQQLVVEAGDGRFVSAEPKVSVGTLFAQRP